MFNLGLGRFLPALHVPPADLTSKTALITGANSGIGYAIASSLASQGCTVYLCCRSAEKAAHARDALIAGIGGDCAARIKILQLDTSSLKSIRECAESYIGAGKPRIDLLFHNAGIGHTNSLSAWSPDGFDAIYATNFLGSFLLTYLLESHLASKARVIFTSSTGQYGGKISDSFSTRSVRERCEPGFHTVPAAAEVADMETMTGRDTMRYSNTKMMQCAMAKLLQMRWNENGNFKESGWTAHSFTPGFTVTEIFNKFEHQSWSAEPMWSLLKKTLSIVATNVKIGAATGVWLAGTNDQNVVSESGSGGYYDRCTRRTSRAELINKATLQRLWKRWEADAAIEWK